MRKCVKLLIILITLSKNYDYIQHKSSNLSGQLSLSCDKTKLCFKFRMGDGILKKNVQVIVLEKLILILMLLTVDNGLL